MKPIYLFTFISFILLLVCLLISLIPPIPSISSIEKDDTISEMNVHLQNNKKVDDVEGLFKMAGIYRFGRGEDGALRNLKKSFTVYQYIRKIGNQSQRAKANLFLQDLLDEINVEKREKKRKKELSLLTERNRKIYNDRIKEKENNYFHQFNNPDEQIINGFDYELENAILENLRDNLINGTNGTNARGKRETTPNFIANDKQNVHDPMVVRSLKGSLANLPTNIDQNNLRDLETIIRQKNKTKAIKTFEKVMANPDKIIAFDKREVDILNDVWTRINDPINSDRRNDMIDNLCLQLEDGSEVCSMGRATRILQTLEGTDKANLIKIRPEWAIKEEINNNAINIYNYLTNNLPIEQKKLMEIPEDNLSQSEREIVENFKINYKSKLKEKLMIDYQNILSEEYINEEIEKAVLAI